MTSGRFLLWGALWHVRPLHNVSWTRTSLFQDVHTIPIIEHFSVKQQLRRKTGLSLTTNRISLIGQGPRLLETPSHSDLGHFAMMTTLRLWRLSFMSFQMSKWEHDIVHWALDKKTYLHAGMIILWVIWGAEWGFRCRTSSAPIVSKRCLEKAQPIERTSTVNTISEKCIHLLGLSSVLDTSDFSLRAHAQDSAWRTGSIYPIHMSIVSSYRYALSGTQESLRTAMCNVSLEELISRINSLCHKQHDEPSLQELEYDGTSIDPPFRIIL